MGLGFRHGAAVSRKGAATVLLAAAILCGILHLALDQAGAVSLVGELRPLAPGPAASARVDVPPGRYTVAVRMRLRERLDRVSVTAGGRILGRSSVAGSHWARVDVPVGVIDVGRGGIDALVEVSPAARAQLIGVVLAPALPLALDRAAAQRLLGVAGLVLAFAAVSPWLRRRSRLLLLLPPLLLLVRLPVFHLTPYTGGDQRSAFYPWYELARREVGEGRVPLWNPWTYLGVPHLANIQSQVVYPPVTASLLAGLSFPRREMLLWTLNLLLAGFGAAAAARRSGTSEQGAALAGTLFMLGPFVIYPEHGPIRSVTALLPWALAFALRRDGALGLSLTLALAFLAGHLQMFSYVMLALACVVLLPPVPRRRALSLRGHAGACLLGGLLSCILALPFLEYGLLSTRGSGLTPEHADLRSTPPGDLARALRVEWGERRIGLMPEGRKASAAVVTGLLGLPLVAAALADLRRPRHRTPTVALLFLGVAGASVGLGDVGPLSPSRLLAHVPLFSGQRFHGRALAITALAFCLLAGRGLDRWRAAAGRLRVVAPPVAVGLVLLASACLVCARTGHADGAVVTGAVLQGALLASVAAAALLLRRHRRALGLALLGLAAAERADDAIGQRPGGFPSLYRSGPAAGRPPAAELRELQLVSSKHNDAILHRRRSPWGYDPVIPRRTALAWNALSPSLFPFDRRGRLEGGGEGLSMEKLLTPRAVAMLEAMGVARIVGPPRRQAPRNDGRGSVVERGRGTLSLFTLPGARRARLLSMAATAPTAAGAERWLGQGLAAIDSGVTSARVLPLVVEDPNPAHPPARKGRRGEPLVRDATPCEVHVTLPRHGAGHLLLADAYYPGWEAVVDGHLAPILPANMALRAVPLTGGEREVVLRYRPFSFRLGLFASLLGVVTLLLARDLKKLPR